MFGGGTSGGWPSTASTLRSQPGPAHAREQSSTSRSGPANVSTWCTLSGPRSVRPTTTCSKRCASLDSRSITTSRAGTPSDAIDRSRPRPNSTPSRPGANLADEPRAHPANATAPPSSIFASATIRAPGSRDTSIVSGAGLSTIGPTPSATSWCDPAS